MSTIAPVRSVAHEATFLAAHLAGRALAPVIRPARLVLGWPVSSQLVARHNAKLAEEALLLRRSEREEVTRFLETLADPSRSA